MALVFFTITALLTSGVAAGMRGQTLLARRQARTTADLYGFARKLAGIADLDDLLWATAWPISSMLKVEVAILLPEAGTLAVRAAYPPEDRVDAADLAAASWA